MRKREPLDIIPGILAGAVIGLTVAFFVMPFYPLFPGDFIVLGAIVGGPLGYWLGNDFFVWFREGWW